MSILKQLPNLPLGRAARVFALVAVAMATGHLIQAIAARESSVVAQDISRVPVDIVHLSAGTDDGPTIVFLKPAPETLTAAVAPEQIGDVLATLPCSDDLSLEALPDGMIGVALRATCRTGQRIVLRHAGLAVTGKIGSEGSFQTVVPALSVAEVVEVLFPDGQRVSQTVTMPEVAAMRRFGVQWQGAAAFAVQSFENGADFGQVGVVSAQNPGSSLSGMLTLLGDATVENPLMAQIYTYPADPLRPVEIVVEAAVTPDTCGHDLLGDVIFSQAGRAMKVDLTLAMPDCSGVGDFLVLKNLATDLKIAAN
jgi:hypothetical protein